FGSVAGPSPRGGSARKTNQTFAVFAASRWKGSRYLSVKVSRLHVRGERLVQPPEAITLDAGDAVVLLQPAFDDQERAGEDGAAVALEGVGIDDDVGDAGLVLQAEEDESFGGAGALADDAEPAGADALAAAQAGKLAGGVDVQGAQAFALEGHRMGSDGHAGAAQVGGDAVAEVHLRE